jgi:poly(3-hydroxyalkanoate) synthetase
MYAYYLRSMYLDNKLREPGALTMAGAAIDLSRITIPAYVYASRDDHIVPWRSAFETTRLLSGDCTFVLGASGHIAGVINPPHPPRRNYWTNDLITDVADDWLARAQSDPRQLVARTGTPGLPARSERARSTAARRRRHQSPLRWHPPQAATSGPLRDAGNLAAALRGRRIPDRHLLRPARNIEGASSP